MRQRRAFVVILLLCQFAGVGMASSEEPLGFRIIANASLPQTRISRSDAAAIFLKKTTEWPTGEKIKPVDLPPSSSIRIQFSRAVLGKSIAYVAAYWQDMIFSGRDVPPPEKSSDAEIVSYVRRVPGAVGYVSPACPLGEGVRELMLIE